MVLGTVGTTTRTTVESQLPTALGEEGADLGEVEAPPDTQWAEAGAVVEMVGSGNVRVNSLP